MMPPIVLPPRHERPAIATAFSLGIVGSFVLGTGMCLTMSVLGSGTATMVGGIVVGLMGIAMASVNYPLCKRKEATLQCSTSSLLGNTLSHSCVRQLLHA